MAKSSTKFIEVTKAYQGRPTNETLIEKGLYEVGDPRLLGFEPFLVRSGRAIIVGARNAEDALAELEHEITKPVDVPPAKPEGEAPVAEDSSQEPPAKKLPVKDAVISKPSPKREE